MPPAGCRSSVVERVIGNDEVPSSILGGSTSENSFLRGLMKRPLSRFLLGAVIFLWFSYKIFPRTFDPLFYDTCSVAYVDMQVERMLNIPVKNNKKLQEASEKIDRLLASENIPEHEKLEAKKDMLSYGWYINNKQCPMPEEVEAALFKWSLPSGEAGTKDCSDDFYLKEAEAGSALLMANKKKSAEIEKQLLSSILAGAQESAEAKELIKKRWEDTGFRHSVIVATLQVSQRVEQGCRNPNKPLQSLVREILKDYR